MTETMYGTVGGNGGKEFADYTVPTTAKIKEIHVYAGIYVDGLQLGFGDGNELSWLPRIGGSGGHHHVFVLAEGEYVTGISGRCGRYVDSICIHTNQRDSEVFGGKGGDNAYMLSAGAGSEIVGFFGRADWYVDALGVIVRTRKAGASTAEARTRQAAAAVLAAPAAALPAAAAPAPAKSEVKAAPGAAKTAATPAAAAPAKSKAKPAPAAAKAAATPAAAAPAKSKAKAAPAAGPKAATQSAAGKAAASAAKSATVPAPAEPQAAAKPAAAPAARSPRPEELMKVEGIGPKIAGILVDNGILDLNDLAAASVERLRAILDSAGSRYRIADPASWPEQAGLGVKGDWEGLALLQAKLRGGRHARR